MIAQLPRIITTPEASCVIASNKIMTRDRKFPFISAGMPLGQI
jgi:hypothetical protein